VKPNLPHATVRPSKSFSSAGNIRIKFLANLSTSTKINERDVHRNRIPGIVEKGLKSPKICGVSCHVDNPRLTFQVLSRKTALLRADRVILTASNRFRFVTNNFVPSCFRSASGRCGNTKSAQRGDFQVTDAKLFFGCGERVSTFDLQVMSRKQPSS